MLCSEEAPRQSRFFEFHSFALCRKVSRSEIVAEIPSLLLALGIASVLSVTTQVVMINGEDVFFS